MNCKFISLFLCAILIFVAFSTQATVIKNLGTAGETFFIKEPDVLAELKQRAVKNPSREQMLDQVKNYQPAGLHVLPRALADKIFLVDMAYTLDRDLIDGDGKIIYPKGYTFNPLDYISLPSGLVIIDGEDSSQLKWFKGSPYFANHQARLLISNGFAADLIETLKRPVFYLTDDIAGRLQLTSVPSVVIQKKNMLQIQEFYVPMDRQGRAGEIK